MAIKGLTDRKEARFPRIGFLRKGGPKRMNSSGKEIMGLDLDHFRFDSDDAEACAAFDEAYGSEPKRVNIFFPWPEVEQNFQAWKEAYTASALQHRCDGETCVLWLDSASGEYRTDPKPCPGGCNEIGYLSVIIPELGRFAYITVLTHSINDIMELQSNLEAYQLLGGHLRGVPFVLRRIERKISTPSGKGNGRVRRAKWLMHLETKPEWTRLKLAGMEMDAIPANVRAQLSAPVEAQYVIAQYQDEQAAARMEAMSYEEKQETLRVNVERMRGPQRSAFDEGEYREQVVVKADPPATRTIIDTETGLVRTVPAAATVVVKAAPPKVCICTGDETPNPDCPLHGAGFKRIDTQPKPAAYQPEPGEDVWADWRNPQDAQAWAWNQGKFKATAHMQNAYAKVKEDCKPANYREMWRCWYEYVTAHEDAPAASEQADTDAAEGDWADIDAHGHEVPQFS